MASISKLFLVPKLSSPPKTRNLLTFQKYSHFPKLPLLHIVTFQICPDCPKCPKFSQKIFNFKNCPESLKKKNFKFCFCFLFFWKNKKTKTKLSLCKKSLLPKMPSISKFLLRTVLPFQSLHFLKLTSLFKMSSLQMVKLSKNVPNIPKTS